MKLRPPTRQLKTLRPKPRNSLNSVVKIKSRGFRTRDFFISMNGTFVLTVALAIICSTVGPIFAQTKADKKAAKMKAEITKLGTGPTAHIYLRLNDGSRVAGYVSEIKADSFVIVSDQSGAATEIQYADAEKASRPKTGMSNIKKGFLIFGGVLSGVLVYCLISKRCQE